MAFEAQAPAAEEQGMFQAGPQNEQQIPQMGDPEQGGEIITQALDTLATFALAQKDQGNTAVADILAQLVQVIAEGGQQAPPPGAPAGPVGPPAAPAISPAGNTPL